MVQHAQMTLGLSGKLQVSNIGVANMQMVVDIRYPLDLEAVSKILNLYYEREHIDMTYAGILVPRGIVCFVCLCGISECPYPLA